jgi:hypothetical protein
VPGERPPLGQEDLALQLADPADHAHRRAVQVGALTPPLLQDQVDGVAGRAGHDGPRTSITGRILVLRQFTPGRAGRRVAAPLLSTGRS